MKKKIIINTFVFSFIALLLFVAYNCNSDSPILNPTGSDTGVISGTITFVDSNFGSSTLGYYDIAAFTSWPPTGPPSADDSLVISKVGNEWHGTFSMTGVNNGRYFIAVGWRRITGGASPVMGIYGCDTAHVPPVGNSTCPIDTSQMQKVIINNNSAPNINFLSWADTTKKIF